MATTDQGLGEGTAALQFPAFRLYLIARFCTVFCAEMQSVAVGWQVYQITRKPLDLGLTGFVQFLPGIALVCRCRRHGKRRAAFLIQIETPDQMRGRVDAVDMIFIGACSQLGEIRIGLNRTTARCRTCRGLGGVGAVIVTVLWACMFPESRNADKLKGAVHTSTLRS